MPKWNPKWPVVRTEIAPGLHMFASEVPSGRVRHCYLLERKGGNVLFHGADRRSFYEEFADFFDHAGGIHHQVFTHAPEVSKVCAWLTERYGTQHWLSAIDQGALRNQAPDGFFETPPETGRWIPHLKAVALPGHTAGFTGYVLSHEGRRYLLSGDFIIPGAHGEGWRAAVHSEQILNSALESIEAIRKARFDAFLPNMSHRDNPPPQMTGEGHKAEMLDGALAFLRRKYKIRDAA